MENRLIFGSERPRPVSEGNHIHYESRTTWRDLLRAIGRIEHLNNLLTMMQVLSEIRQVNFIVHQGKSLKDLDRIHEARSRDMLPDGPGSVSGLIENIDWDGGQLDSKIVVQFGPTVLQ